MHIEDLYQYCLSKKAVTEAFPFDQDTLVFKVAGKIFLLLSLENWEAQKARVNLKCDPEYALELRADYEGIYPAYHMNKTHWNSVNINQDVPDKLVYELVDHSYKMVVEKLPKKQRELLLG